MSEMIEDNINIRLKLNDYVEAIIGQTTQRLEKHGFYQKSIEKQRNENQSSDKKQSKRTRKMMQTYKKGKDTMIMRQEDFKSSDVTNDQQEKYDNQVLSRKQQREIKSNIKRQLP
eukprot:CAMPEP_0176357150 /NCGR_PEP_ID=MMETSP0126-20121128/14557_1 /TAXON_ID=141414 ORGANISM="Strombidinopsis acuminatum, Strain SPMC142" /NCGR_SAMPLE_ID=MMETSP0126 /ASSEMBLY_ACC=CAM_ASM_000229 /LENGTH=114 /DNA_ID=CAMNT_0017710613 /DNA_START=1682 /DNA_END=2026 /DNA_ORIENTATION=-